MSYQTKRFDFKNKDGHSLSGKLELPSKPFKALAIFAHCFTCSKNILAASRISRGLTDADIAVLRFDFTGLGSSEGDFANSGFSSNVDDLIAAYQALENEYQEAPKILIGHSLGGAAVLAAAPQLPALKAVASIAAPSEAEHVLNNFAGKLDEIESKGFAEVSLANRTFTIKKEFIDDVNDDRFLSRLSDFEGAVMVMHGPGDQTVSIDHAARIFKSANHPRSFISLDQADHLLSNKKDADYVATVLGAWVSRFLEESEEEANETHDSESTLVELRGVGNHEYTHLIRARQHQLLADEPKSLGGDDLGMGPYDLLLSSLGACTAMTVKMYARRKEWPVDDVEISLEHQKIHGKDCETCDNKTGRVDQITKTIKIKGNLSSEQTERLREIAEKCPVNRTLKSEVAMKTVHID
ncbi:alpha/beta fold hydrolase [Pseudobacteriovorax antillogorgiicola]|uniref:Putative redox protein n=1 Tax=Pseudobacteriovorax antillogorgiicola TaxID=1513793 RepID=A0A1Y6BSS8_9BACT|nr:alpha/beta fold hydrolase [Pseudobacteriovorax antillogorgiicola]TCS53027.1 putative redox protein [Pseudobacteriovorax antillogorgiicola]SMF26812.1 putative redox protein [Pseudobacteriovorax antillogorgiicola]